MVSISYTEEDDKGESKSQNHHGPMYCKTKGRLTTLLLYQTSGKEAESFIHLSGGFVTLDCLGPEIKMRGEMCHIGAGLLLIVVLSSHIRQARSSPLVQL